MSTDTEQLHEDISKVKRDINQLRDEIRVRLHLGSMDARDAFATIERELEHIGSGITRASQRALESAQARLKELSAALRGTAAPKR